MPRIAFTMKGQVPYADAAKARGTGPQELPPIQSGQQVGQPRFGKRAPVDNATKSWLYQLDDDL